MTVKILRLVSPLSAEHAAAPSYGTPKAPARAVARRRVLIAIVASRMRSEKRLAGSTVRRIGSMSHELPS